MVERFTGPFTGVYSRSALHMELCRAYLCLREIIQLIDLRSPYWQLPMAVMDNEETDFFFPALGLEKRSITM